MDIQRLRNLTTHKLHTKMEDIYKDIELITGEEGIMTHQIPNACAAIEPFLREVVVDQRFWDGKYDPTHTGEINIPVMDADQRIRMFQRFEELPSPLIGKNVIPIIID